MPSIPALLLQAGKGIFKVKSAYTYPPRHHKHSQASPWNSTYHHEESAHCTGMTEREHNVPRVEDGYKFLRCSALPYWN